ncbi:MAG: flagellar assembly factor FliW [Oligoflexia bacterium]|nr:MAG: flagellar assembly factor FliW [Oligoflexia bacterium]
MVIQTTRFGQIEVQTEDLIQFPEGIVGFPDLNTFVLLDDPNDDIFAWLQSCNEPAIAFPVLEPELFAENYKVVLTKSDYEGLKMQNMERARQFCIVTIPDDPTKMTANMKAPIIVNVPLRIARQCVLQDNGLAIREPIFAKLQQRVFQNPTQSIKSQSQGLDVAIRLPESQGPEVTA